MEETDDGVNARESEGNADADAGGRPKARRGHGLREKKPADQRGHGNQHSRQRAGDADIEKSDARRNPRAQADEGSEGSDQGGAGNTQGREERTPWTRHAA